MFKSFTLSVQVPRTKVNRRAIVVVHQQFEKAALSVLEHPVVRHGSLFHHTKVASFSTGSALSPRELHSLEF